MPRQYVIWDGLKAVPLSQLTPEFFTGDGTGDSERLTAVGAYRAVSWVRRCIQLRAAAISGLPFEVVESGEPVDWPLGDRLPYLLWLAEVALCLRGAAYWLKERRGRMLLGLRHLAPQTITPEYNTSSGLVGFTRTVGAVTTRLKPEDVVYFFEPSPEVEIGPGRPLAEAALEAARIAHNADRYVSGFFERGAITATLLSVEGNPPTEELRRLESWWKRLLRGVGRAWETVAVRATVKPQQIGVSPGKDLAVDGLLTMARQQIAVAFGVPQTLIEDAANYATAKEHRLSFYSETVLPRAKWMEAVLNEQLFSPLGLRFRFVPERLEIFQQDEAAKAQAVVALVQAGVMTLEEARRQMGLEEAEEPGPVPIEAETRSVKAVLFDLRQWRDKARRAEREGKPEDALEFKSEVVPPELREYVRSALERGGDPFSFLANIRAGAEVKIEPDRKYEADLRKRILAVLQQYMDEVAKATSEAEALAALEGFGDAARGAIEPVLVQVVTDVMLAEAVATGLYPDVAAINRAALEWAASYSYELVSGLTETTRDIVRHAMTSFLSTPGMTVGDLRAMLEPAFGPMRAEMIAITEVTRAANQATRVYQEMIREWGLDLARVWRTSNDERVCPVCGPNEGRAEWDWTFPDGPPAHPRCRCWTTLEVRRKRK